VGAAQARRFEAVQRVDQAGERIYRGAAAAAAAGLEALIQMKWSGLAIILFALPNFDQSTRSITLCTDSATY
jgi:hypothetical protein